MASNSSARGSTLLTAAVSDAPALTSGRIVATMSPRRADQRTIEGLKVTDRRAHRRQLLLASVASLIIFLAANVSAGLVEGSEGSSNDSNFQAPATFSGPLTIGHVIEPLSALPTNLAQHNYVEQEFSASGAAHAFRASSTRRPTGDGVLPRRRLLHIEPAFWCADRPTPRISAARLLWNG